MVPLQVPDSRVSLSVMVALPFGSGSYILPTLNDKKTNYLSTEPSLVTR